MAFENNFVPVPVGIGGTLIDPVLKLRLTTGRWNPESNAKGGTIDIQLHHDAEIQPGRLTMPTSEEDRALSAMLGAKNDVDNTIFKSPESRKLIDIVVDINKRDDEVALICGDGKRPAWAEEPTFRTKAGLIQMAERDIVSAHPWQTLLYMWQSLPLMRYWESEYATHWGSKTISVYLARSLALELAQHAGLVMPDGDDDLVLISSREIAEIR